MQVIPFFGPFHGGSAHAAYDLSRELSEREHDVTIFTSDYLFSKQWTSGIPRVKVYPFKNWVKVSNFFVTPGLVNQAYSEIGKFDIIHLHNFRSFQNSVVSHYALKYHVPYVLQAHGSLPIIMASKRIKHLYDVFLGHRILKATSKAIALNDFEAKQFTSMGLPRERVEVIPNGLVFPDQLNILKGNFRSKFNISPNEKIILFLGRIHKIKGIDTLVKAFDRVNHNLKNTRLVIVGPDDGYLDELSSLIRMFDLQKNVLLVGPLYGKYKFEAYLDCDVYVLPSLYETFPISLLEAYACSKPVIVSKVGNTNELVIEGETGFLFPPGDIDQLDRHIEFLLCNDNKALDMGRKGASFVKCNFSIDVVIDKLESLYRNVANRT